MKNEGDRATPGGTRPYRERTQVFITEGRGPTGGAGKTGSAGGAGAPGVHEEGEEVDINLFRDLLAQVMNGQVVVSSPGSLNVLMFDGGEQSWKNSSVAGLVAGALPAALSGAFSGGVVVSGPTSGHILMYTAEHTWTNVAPANMIASAVGACISDMFSGEVAVSAPTWGHVLTYIADSHEWQNLALSQLAGWEMEAALTAIMKGPVAIITPTEGDVLSYDLQAEGWVNRPASELAAEQLTDFLEYVLKGPVVVGNPQHGQVLVYDDESEAWENKGPLAWGSGNRDTAALWDSNGWTLISLAPAAWIPVPGNTVSGVQAAGNYEGYDTINCASVSSILGSLGDSTSSLAATVNSLGVAVGAIVRALTAGRIIYPPG